MHLKNAVSFNKLDLGVNLFICVRIQQVLVLTLNSVQFWFGLYLSPILTPYIDW